jgi:hypothetical protein
MSLVYGATNAGGWMGPLIGGLFAEYVFFTVQPLSFINAAFNFVAMLLVISLLRTIGPLNGQHMETSDNETSVLGDQEDLFKEKQV